MARSDWTGIGLIALAALVASVDSGCKKAERPPAAQAADSSDMMMSDSSKMMPGDTTGLPRKPLPPRKPVPAGETPKPRPN